MSTTKKLLMCAGGAILLGIGITIAVRSSWQRGGVGEKTGYRQPQRPSSHGIFGSYVFTKETSSQKVLSDAEVVLQFIRPDVVTLRAVKPGEVFTDVGAFNISDDRITISLPETGWAANNSEYSYDGQQLVLPVLIFGEGEGRSTWTRVSGEGDPLNEVVGRFYGEIGKQSRGALLRQLASELQQYPKVTEAKVSGERVLSVTYSWGYQEFFLAPEMGSAESSQGKPAEEETSVTPRLHPASWQAFTQFPRLPGAGGPPGLNVEEKFANWLLYEPEPVSHNDAPSSKNALLLSAFHSLPLLIPTKEGKPPHYMTFQEAGENLEQISTELAHAGYNVDRSVDQQVSLKNLYQLMKRPWGVVYFNTHAGLLEEKNENGDTLLSTGEQVPLRWRASPELRDQYLQNAMKDAVGTEYEKFKPCVTVAFVYDTIPFIALKSCFFRMIGAYLSSSLVFINGCESARSRMLRSALNAKSLVGWKHEVQAQLAAEISGPFWRCLRRKTRADREATFYAIEYLWQRNTYYKNQARAFPDGSFDPHNFVVYRQGRSNPEESFTFHEANFMRVVREWVCQRKGCQGLDETVAALYKCDKTDVGLGASEFCKNAFNGVNVPDKEIDTAKEELCGSQGPRLTLVEK